MFTGIVQGIGQIKRVREAQDVRSFIINLPELKGEELLKERGIKSHFLMEF